MALLPLSLKQMRERGYCLDTIRTQIEHKEGEYYRSIKAHSLIEKIEKAFDKVTLGNGVGLREGRGLDNYADRATLKKLNESDIKGDWRDISSELLNEYNSSLSFFDEEGMLFHIPAFMIAELKHEYHCGMSYPFTHREQSIYSLLNDEQRQTVREFLKFLLDDPDYEFDKPDIKYALEHFWI